MPARPVRAILARDTIVTAEPHETARDAAVRMAANCCGCVLVMQDGRLVGIFTERDLLKRVVAADRDPAGTRLIEVMTHDPDTIDARQPVQEAIRRMDEFCYRHLPVTEGGRVIGVISMRDMPLNEIAGMAKELDDRHALAERMW